MVREEVGDEHKSDDGDGVNAQVEEEKESPSVVTTRRVSPREHASTRSLEVPVSMPVKRRSRPPRMKKEKRLVTYYKVEWEGYSLDDATWKPVDELVDEGLQWMIDDYEMGQHEPGDEVELAIMSIFTTDTSESLIKSNKSSKD